EVAGRMTFDAATADAATTLDNATKSITVDFPTPLDEGDSFWVFIAPADLSQGEVRFTAFSGDECSTPIGGRFGECSAGRITPVDLTIRESRGKVTWFDCTMDCSQLGEPVEKLTLTLPDGKTFATGEETCTLTPNADGEFCFALLSNDLPSLAGQALRSVYESESAVVEDRISPITIPADYTVDARNKIADKAPYLFFEDFSEIGEYHTSNENGGVNSVEGYILDDWGLTGWNAARGGTIAHTCIMANCYIATHSGLSNSRAKGRIDTCPLPIKTGKTVNVKVSFDAGYTKKNGSGGSDQANSYATCTFGRTDVADAGTPLSSSQALSAVTMSEQKVSQLSDTSNLPDKWSNQIVNDCSSSSRLTWQIYSNRTSIWATTNVTIYCHIDNIRATIVR
ncbi:MAG: hypothetical protein K2J51_08125, partial [Alistipes sp.]|nr:hypothetical protein [Alistipes sp.]